MAGGMVSTIIDGENHEVEASGEYNVVSVDGPITKLEQGGNTYIISTDKLPQDAKDKLVSIRPDLKVFLNNGPLYIAE